MSIGYDYGRDGIVGIGTPQANPTVEAEMGILLPPAVLPVTVRLTSSAVDPLDRLREYLLGLPQTLSNFDTLRPRAFGFGCTGSSYLVAPDAQTALIAEIEDNFGYPVVTTTDAIGWQLRSIGARRIAIASPYPARLSDAAHAFWEAAGFEVAAIRRIETGQADTRGIYTLGSNDARPAAEELQRLPVDAVLLSGTGMPTLKLVAAMAASGGPPVYSSNLCLAMRLCAVADIPFPAAKEWGQRLTQATTRPVGGQP